MMVVMTVTTTTTMMTMSVMLDTKVVMTEEREQWSLKKLPVESWKTDDVMRTPSQHRHRHQRGGEAEKEARGSYLSA